MSERAFKEVESETCHNCGTKFGKEDIIILNPENGDLDKMEENMRIRRERAKQLKKEKKKGEKRKVSSVNGTTVNGSDNFTVPKIPSTSGLCSNSMSKKSKLDPKQVDKVKKAQDVATNSKKDSKTLKQTEKIDAKQSKIYKSLFTSSENKPGKDKQAHWVTYNPYHL